MDYLDCLDEILQVEKVIPVHLVIEALMVVLESKVEQVTRMNDGLWKFLYVAVNFNVHFNFPVHFNTCVNVFLCR